MFDLSVCGALNPSSFTHSLQSVFPISVDKKRKWQELLPLKVYPFTLTHCILYYSSTVICWMSGMSGLFCCFYSFLMENLLANNVDPHQMLRNVASNLGLHCLPMTLLRVLGKNGLIRCVYKPIYSTVRHAQMKNASSKRNVGYGSLYHIFLFSL